MSKKTGDVQSTQQPNISCNNINIQRNIISKNNNNIQKMILTFLMSIIPRNTQMLDGYLDSLKSNN
ncbi:hypothetical protein N9140_01000, partial [bacterium]|nr:hypothetical protein [bacterium]